MYCIRVGITYVQTSLESSFFNDILRYRSVRLKILLALLTVKLYDMNENTNDFMLKVTDVCCQSSNFLIHFGIFYLFRYFY